MESGRKRNRVFDFVKKAYEMVDDPSTDQIVSWGPDGTSFIVWKQRECKRDLLTKLLQITTFARFEAYGFRKIASGEEEHLELACNDFVRGKPELLDKIGERYVAHVKAFSDKRYKPYQDRLKNCKTREEWELVLKEQQEIFDKDSKERKEARELEKARRLIRTQRLQDQLHHMDMDSERNIISDFVKKAYEMVDDPSTDLIVSWGPSGRTFVVWDPQECARDLLPKLLQITNFQRFQTYGFRKLVSREDQLEFTCTDFVKGKPELLDKICERYVAQLQADYDKRYKPFQDRLKNCKTTEELQLAFKERKEIFDKEARELAKATLLAKAAALEDQNENNIHHLQLAINRLNDTLQITDPTLFAPPRN